MVFDDTDKHGGPYQFLIVKNIYIRHLEELHHYRFDARGRHTGGFYQSNR
jgi:hypothetical protein